jgi:hypothetical protein
MLALFKISSLIFEDQRETKMLELKSSCFTFFLLFFLQEGLVNNLNSILSI